MGPSCRSIVTLRLLRSISLESEDRSEFLTASIRSKSASGCATPCISLTSEFDVDNHPAILLRGMSVKAETLTGKRHTIGFVLATLREHTHDAMRERNA